MPPRQLPDLGGLRVLLTRAPEDNATWARALAARGARVAELPCLTTAVLPAAAELRAALAQAAWLVLGSRRGVRAVAELAAPLPARADGSSLRVACVGRATADLAEHLLGRADLVPEAGHLAALADSLATELPGPTTLVLATSDRGRTELEQRLGPAGHRVHRVAVYATRPTAPVEDPPALADLDAVVLASPSALEGLRAQRRVPADLPLVALGPTTAAAVRAAGLRLAAEAPTRDLDGVAAALAVLAP